MKKILSVLAIVVTTVLLSVSAGAAVLPAPTVKATTMSSTRINVSWTKVAGAEKYALYMAERHGNNFAEFNFYEPKGSYGYDDFKLLGKTTALSYTVPNLTLGTMYKFVLVPLDITNGKTTRGKQSVAVLCATGGYNPKVKTEGTVKTDYTYDSNGNVLAYSYYNDGKLSDKTVYTYDPNGNALTSATYYDGKLRHKKVYTYNSKGNLLTNDLIDYQGAYPHTYPTSYTYDSKGNVLSGKHSGESFGWSFVYTYDSKGNILTASEGLGIGSRDTVYTYDSKGNTLTATRTEYNPDDTKSISKTVYAYDSKGYLLNTATYNSTGSLISKDVYKYDSKGNLLTDGKSVYTYDSKGNVLTSTLYNTDGSVGSKNVYTY